MPVCQHCSRCCHYWLDGRLKKCKFLRGHLCSVYSTRLGKILDVSKDGKIAIRCILRKDSSHDYICCPMNTDRPLFSEKEEK